MSRSYKNVANVSDGAVHNWFKKYSNHKNRQRERAMLHEYELDEIEIAEALEIPSGCAFKHNGESYNIRDWSFSYFTELTPTGPGWFSWDPEEWRNEVERMKRK